jgi:hypothetical protein
MTMNGSTDFWVHCGECGHAWVAAILPMAVDDFARVANRATCPRGHRAKVYCGKGDKATAARRSPQQRGGQARAASMTAEQRSAAASKAARARWQPDE